MTLEEPTVMTTETEMATTVVNPAKEAAKEVMMEVLETTVTQPISEEVPATEEEMAEEEEEEAVEEEEIKTPTITLEQVPEYLASGTQFFALSNFESAVEKFAIAVEAL
jgi:hypothetical protein